MRCFTVRQSSAFRRQRSRCRCPRAGCDSSGAVYRGVVVAYARHAVDLYGRGFGGGDDDRADRPYSFSLEND